jgi:heme-degrading monooxygenase HmoA
MIARVWSARCPPAHAGAYAHHLRSAVLTEVQSLEGYRGATLLQRPAGDDVEITVITWWSSLADVRAFAGHDVERAVISKEARALLSHADDRVRHFDVVVHEPISE